MAKITSPTDLTSITDEKDFMRFTSQLINNIVDIINGKITFNDNITSQSVTVSFTAANTDTAISHKLNKTGVKYFPVSKSVACDVFNGSKSQTTNTIYLQSTQIANVTLELY